MTYLETADRSIMRAAPGPVRRLLPVILSLALLGGDVYAQDIDLFGSGETDQLLEETFDLIKAEDPNRPRMRAEEIKTTWLSNLPSWSGQAEKQELKQKALTGMRHGRRGVRLLPGLVLGHTTDVPEAGEYRIWISHAVYGAKSPFELKLSGSNTPAFTYGAFSTGWNMEDEFPIRFENAHQRVGVPPSGTIVWEYRDAQLRPGQTEFRLKSAAESRSPVVESILVTRSRAFAPSRSRVVAERTLRRLFLRVRVRGIEEPVGVSAGLRYMSRFSGTGRYNGLYTGALGRYSGSGAGGKLLPGEWSQWKDATFPLTTGGGWAIANVGISSRLEGELDVEMAWYPNEGTAAKSVSTAMRQGYAYVLLPVSRSGFGGNPRDGWSPAGMFGEATVNRFRPLEALEENMDAYCERALEAVGGPTDPLRRLEFHAFVQGPVQSIEAAMPRLRSMGLNRFSHGSSEGAIWLSYSGLGFSTDRRKAIDAVAAHYRGIREKQGRDAFRMVKLGDEIGQYAGAGKINASPEGLALFHDYIASELERLGKGPSFLGVDDLGILSCYAPHSEQPVSPDELDGDILPPPDLPDGERIDDLLSAAAGPEGGIADEFARDFEDRQAGSEDIPAPHATPNSQEMSDAAAEDLLNRTPAERRRLQVMSRRFVTWLTAWYYRGKTEGIRAAFPEADTFTNHDTSFMWGSRFDPLWFMNCRYGGTTMAWAEDWAWASRGGTASCGIQTVSFYGAIMDCAAREHGGPRGFHTIATSNHAARKIFSLVGEGVFFQDLYHYGPPYFRKGGTKDCWGHKHWVYKQVAQALAALKPAETRIVGGRADPARVAVLVNLSDDLRDDEIPGFLNERLLIYLALRHAQFPVDLLLERDLRQQSPIDLGEYRAIYLTGMRLEREGWNALRKWCEGGGTLIATGMAATQDEFGDPMPETDAFLGARRAVASRSKERWHPDSIPGMQPLDRAAFDESRLAPAASAPVVGVKFDLAPFTESTVLGRFGDSSPAACTRKAGEGRVVLYGFQLGMSYRFDTARQGGKIEGYRDDLRALIVRPAADASGGPRVTASSPLVETTTFGDEQGLAVMLNDFTWDGDREMSLTVRSERPVHEVAATVGKVKHWQQTSGKVEITCQAPNAVDVIVLEYERGDSQ